VIAVQRKGRRIVLRREEPTGTENGKGARQYKRLLRVPDADEADRWSWEWRGSDRGLVSRRRPAR
jgi:hypothetical protein